METPILNQIQGGIELIKKTVKETKKPADKKAVESAKLTLTTIEKQLKAMKKDEAIRLQYEDKVAYSTIQLLFQCLHMFILSTEGENDLIDEIITYLRSTDNVYVLAERITKAAEARADFAPSSKKVM